MQFNICSAVSKKTELIDILNTCIRQKSGIDIVMICETYLNDIKEKQFKFKDYMLYPIHWQLHKGGGVSTLVKRLLRTKIREDLSLNEPRLVESIFIELEIPGICEIVVGSLYRIPNSSEKEFDWIYKKFINDWEINKQLLIGIDQSLDL